MIAPENDLAPMCLGLESALGDEVAEQVIQIDSLEILAAGSPSAR